MSALHKALAIAALVLGGGAAASEITAAAGTRRLLADIDAGRDRITAVELAQRINGGERVHVIDLRGRDDYERFHIPSAMHATLDALGHTPLPRSVPIVLYAADGAGAARGWMLLRLRGYRQVAYLREGLYEWIVRVHEPALAVDATAAEREEFERLAALSRYFGGQPRFDVPRAEIPADAWTAGAYDSRPSVATSLLVAAIRRRGC